MSESSDTKIDLKECAMLYKKPVKYIEKNFLNLLDSKKFSIRNSMF